MARILVVDTEEKSLDEIRKAILHLNPDIKIAGFISFHALHEETKKLNEEELAAFYDFDLMILDYLSTKPAEWEHRLTELRGKTKSPDTSVCLTSYDDASINRKFISSLHLFNIFYKPFDQLILKESINIALNAKKNVKPVEMRAQTANSTIAALKEVDVVSICETGFLTINDSAIPPQSVSKYFSPLFSHGKKQSVWAQCTMSVALPNKPGFFISKFQYVGMQTDCLMGIRKFVMTHKKSSVSGTAWSLAAPAFIKEVAIAIIDTKDEKAGAFKTDVETNFQNAKVDFVKIDPAKKSEISEVNYDLIINLNPSLKYDDFKNRFSKEAKFFLFSPEPVSDEKIKEYMAVYQDIFTAPLDKPYFCKKLKLHHKDLSLKEINEIHSITTTEKVKAASMVKISEICELYVNISYSRELPYGTTRQFVFMNEDENQITELPAFCNYAELIKPKPGEKTVSYYHQFIFWGMTDHYLKQIRIWLLQSFIQQNKRD